MVLNHVVSTKLCLRSALTETGTSSCVCPLNSKAAAVVPECGINDIPFLGTEENDLKPLSGSSLQPSQ